MKNQKGFTLLEVLIVSIFIISTLTFLFTQFMNLKKSYDYTLNYNTVEGLYGARQINKYLLDNNIKTADILNENAFADISSCKELALLHESYCNGLYTTLNIKKVIISKENLTALKEAIKDDNNYSETLKQYLKKQKVEGYDNSFRIVVEYNDETYASIILEEQA